MSKIIPKYKMHYANLLYYAKSLCDTIDKYSSFFATRGVTAADIQAFEDLILNVRVIEPDYVCFADVSIAVEDKEEAKKKALVMADLVRGYFIIAFGKDSEEYKRLQMKKFASATDNFLVSLLYDEARIAEELLSELSAVGLTQSIIDQLKSDTDDLAAEVDKVADAKATRRSTTIYRIEKYNELYSYVVKYTSIGKILAKEYPEVNYDYFLIYKHVTKKRKKKPEQPPEAPPAPLEEENQD